MTALPFLLAIAVIPLIVHVLVLVLVVLMVLMAVALVVAETTAVAEYKSPHIFHKSANLEVNVILVIPLFFDISFRTW